MLANNALKLTLLFFACIQIVHQPLCADEKTDFNALTTETRKAQTTASVLLQKIMTVLESTAKTNPKGTRIVLKPADVSGAITILRQTLQRAQTLANTLNKKPQANQELRTQTRKLLEDVFAPASAMSILIEFRESLSLLVAALEGENSPSKNMQEWLKRNFSNTSILVDQNIFEQVGLSPKVSHEDLMKEYRRTVADNTQKPVTLRAWRQINYVTRQPVGMLMYKMWFDDKAFFDAVFLKLPKKEMLDAFRYLNMDYLVQIHEVVGALS